MRNKIYDSLSSPIDFSKEFDDKVVMLNEEIRSRCKIHTILDSDMNYSAAQK